MREFYRSPEDERLRLHEGDRREGDRMSNRRRPRSRSALYMQRVGTGLRKRRYEVPGKRSQRKPTLCASVNAILIVPDLLAAPGAINLRIIGDDYFAVLPAGTDPESSELQRAYLQYVVDPLMLRFNRGIANRREQIKQVIAEREKAGGTVTPDVFLVVSRLCGCCRCAL